MDQKVITLIISVVAILATLISSLIGHYFTAKARTSSYKQFLYGKQVDLLIKVIHKQGRFKIYATLLMPDAEEYAERARNDIGDIIKRLFDTHGRSSGYHTNRTLASHSGLP